MREYSNVLESLRLLWSGEEGRDHVSSTEYEQIEQSIKALEIIVNREVNVQAIRKHNYKTYEDYKRLTNLYENSTPLTQEEFDLVIEVLV